jgi:nickel transport protein
VFPRETTLRAAACLAVVLIGSGGAFAHKIKVFATAVGGRIEGTVYFPGGGRAANLRVAVQTPDGRKLGEAVTDANGEFTFAVKEPCDHQLVVETADGHRATCLVEGKEFAPGAAAAPGAEPPRSPPTGSVAAAPPEAPAAPDLEQRIAEAVAKQVRPLQEHLVRSEERRRLLDILGGIGIILGLTGVSFYFLGRRKRG